MRAGVLMESVSPEPVDVRVDAVPLPKVAPGTRSCFPSTASYGYVTCSCLYIMLPRPVVQGVLVPLGFLAEIAQRCGVQIDIEPLGTDETLVSLTGSIEANAC